MFKPLWIACLAPVLAFAADPIHSFSAPYGKVGSIEKADPALDDLIDPQAPIEKLAEGFNWSEGPVWLPQKSMLLFSDVPENIVYAWQEGKGVSVFLTPSGFTGDHYEGRERGSNGLTLTPDGKVALAQHGDRRIALLKDDNKSFETLADRFDGKRFNSPNDLCFDKSGRVFFTDPPYGMQTNAKSETGFNGVYVRHTDGTVELISKDLERPNGVALSPDEKTLYIGNSHGPRPIVYAIPLKDGRAAGQGRVFFDMKSLQTGDRKGVPDGLRVDAKGNLWSSGPGGVVILSPEAKYLGTILTGQATSNCTFGGPDNSILYITADMWLLRVQTKTKR